MAKRKIHDNKCLLLFCLSVWKASLWSNDNQTEAHASGTEYIKCMKARSLYIHTHTYKRALFRAGNFDFNANKIETLTFYISSAAAKVGNIINSERSVVMQPTS